MLFHVTMTVKVPYDIDPASLSDLNAREHTRAAELQRQRKWLFLWRVAGQRANISIFDVESPLELHDILESLPLRPFMEIETTALCRHPGSLADDAKTLSGTSGAPHQ